jgi:hypothetical protein
VLLGPAVLLYPHPEVGKIAKNISKHENLKATPSKTLPCLKLGFTDLDAMFTRNIPVKYAYNSKILGPSLI